DGLVRNRTLAALRTFKRSGGRLILITGRQLDDLLGVFPPVDLVDRIIAENGALLFNPSDGSVETRGEMPPEAFMAVLRARRLSPLSVGRVIGATAQAHEPVGRETIRDLGLDHQVILNGDALMILPAGVHKGSGLATALAQLRVSTSDTVGVGDAENDED